MAHEVTLFRLQLADGTLFVAKPETMHLTTEALASACECECPRCTVNRNVSFDAIRTIAKSQPEGRC
jgi:hypothetical protein